MFKHCKNGNRISEVFLSASEVFTQQMAKLQYASLSGFSTIFLKLQSCFGNPDSIPARVTVYTQQMFKRKELNTTLHTVLCQRNLKLGKEQSFAQIECRAEINLLRRTFAAWNMADPRNPDQPSKNLSDLLGTCTDLQGTSLILGSRTGLLGTCLTFQEPVLAFKEPL